MSRIMVVEDSSLMIAVLRNFIKKDFPDIEVTEAHSGEEAITLYTSHRPDMVFMDIKMPGMDGIEAMERIRAQNPGARIVMCTSLKEPEQEERAKKAGCMGYIMKPFSRQDIVEAVKRYGR